MLKTAFALQQSSEDLTKFAGNYVVTGDTKFKELFFKVSNIRSGKLKRPALLNLSYWYLPDTLKTKHHPLSEPKSLATIITSLPFTNSELKLIKSSHFESEKLEVLENKIFSMVEDGNKSKVLDIYYSNDYHKSKVIIMTSLDILYASLNERFENEIQKLKQEQLDSLIRLFVIIFVLSILKMMLPTTFSIRQEK